MVANRIYIYNRNNFKKRINTLKFLKKKYQRIYFNKFNQLNICSKNLLFFYFDKEYKKHLSSFLFLNFNQKNLYFNSFLLNKSINGFVLNSYFFHFFKSHYSFLFLNNYIKSNNYNSFFFNSFSKYFSGYHFNRGKYLKIYSNNKFLNIYNFNYSNSKYYYSFINKHFIYNLSKKFEFINYLYDPFCFILKKKKFILSIDHLPYGFKNLFINEFRKRKKTNDENEISLAIPEKNYKYKNNRVKWFLLQKTYFSNDSPFYYIIFMGLSCCRRYVLGFLDNEKRIISKTFNFWHNLKKTKKKLIFLILKKIKRLKNLTSLTSFYFRYRFLKNRNLKFKKRTNICFSKVFIKNLFFFKKINPFKVNNNNYNKSLGSNFNKISDFIFIIYYLFLFIVRFKTKKFKVSNLNFFYFIETFKDYLFFFEKSLNFFFSNKVFMSNSLFISLRFKFYSLLFFFFKFHYFLSRFINLYKIDYLKEINKVNKVNLYKNNLDIVRYKICSLFNFNFFGTGTDVILKRNGDVLNLSYIKTFYSFFILSNLNTNKKQFIYLQYLSFLFISLYYNSEFFSKNFLKKFFYIFSYRNNFSFKLFYSKYPFMPQVKIYHRYERFSSVLKKMYYIQKEKRYVFLKRKNKLKYYQKLIGSLMKKKNIKSCKYILKHFKVIRIRNGEYSLNFDKLRLKPLVMNFIVLNKINYKKISKLFFLKKFMLIKFLYFYKFIKLNFLKKNNYKYNLNFINFFIQVLNLTTLLNNNNDVKNSTKNSLFILILFFFLKKLNKNILLNENKFFLNKIIIFKNKFYFVKNL